MRVTATEAKNRFGALCQQAKLSPVVIEKGGEPDSVLLSFAEYQRLLAPKASVLTARRREFNQQHKAWLDAQQKQFEANGLWNDGMQVW